MPQSNLYIVDNADETRNVKRYLTEWCPISKQLDVATGYLEIGGLLALDTQWQKLEKIRIILGNEVTSRTAEVLGNAVAQGFLSRIQASLNAEQASNDFLLGVPAIVDAIRSGKIECRVYDRGKFHAKAYITHFRDDVHANFPASMNVPSGYALVGSSNFTHAGLTKNIELNVQVDNEVAELQEFGLTGLHYGIVALEDYLGAFAEVELQYAAGLVLYAEGGGVLYAGTGCGTIAKSQQPTADNQ